MLFRSVENALAKAEREASLNGEPFDEYEARAEAEKTARSTIRSAMTTYWREKYWDAYKIRDDDEMKRIRGILEVSGLYVYEKENRDVDTVLEEWEDEYDEKYGPN